MAYAELFIRLTNLRSDSYAVELEYSGSGADTSVEPEPGWAVFDFEQLMGSFDDTDRYARVLTDNLFADPIVRSSFLSAANVSDTGGAPLRIRLLADPADAELQNVRWELLRHPETGESLVTNERYLFSRYLRSPNWRRIERRGRSDLRALLMVASPTDLQNYAPEGTRLEPLDVPEEVHQAKIGLGSMRITTLESKGRATLNQLAEEVRAGYDIVYIVCHGAFPRPDKPVLYLEQADGTTARVAGSELAEVFSMVRMPPTLVVLTACQSAGSGSSGAMAAVGPLIARAGVPAVVAMQGKVSMKTAGSFMTRFFKELGRDGQIDRAVALARYDVRHEPDAWMPVLFTRLKDGFIWSATASIGVFSKWPALVGRIREGTCTPILGPGLIEFLLGSQREVAQRWAKKHRFPMAPSERDDLPQVTQYMSTYLDDPETPSRELAEYLESELRERYGSQLPAVLGRDALQAIVSEIGKQRRLRDESEPHRILANLPLAIYISTNPDNLMAEALVEAGKQPEVAVCRWKDDDDWPESIYDRDPDYRPDAQRPLVYHLFGQLRHRNTLVLTEDDYFDFLIGVTDASRKPRLLPTPLVRARADHALLFLGFQVDDWNFRVLFRSIMSQGASRKRPHVAVQIDTEEGRSDEPQRARAYLEKYFGDENISIYWGSADDFLKALWSQWQHAP